MLWDEKAAYPRERSALPSRDLGEQAPNKAITTAAAPSHRPPNKNRRVDRIRETVQQVFIGKEKIVDLLLVGFFSGLHVLIEDVPGVGKTTMAKSLAASVNLDFARIQFTPDLLPGDITGVTVWDQTEKAFVYKEGAIMHQFILADEINRASPRTQSSLLEAMQEETDRESKSSAHRNPVTGAGVTPDGSPATVTGHSSHAWAEVWIEGLVRHLCRLGIPPPTEYGWENWARAVQLHYPNYSEAVKEYCDILCAYVYGGQALDPSWIDSWNRLQNITVSQEHP